ncbi:MAG TPA: hypothetical protein PK513_07485 [Alphaproteobacteria bacterium]|nr:hypothetical protein [Alphaproteobacteria bacterium]USO05667.1 MAG: hypothetical protein H6859_00210 [Rhodospirillales bacterium]HOO82326.1 hypothetical protein [Alphaproteobacteria bacterium]
MVLLRKFSLCVFCLPLVLAGCSFFPEFGPASSETVRSEEGRYKQIEQIDSLSPEEQHARARALVEPDKMVQHNMYVKNADEVRQAQLDKDSSERVVKMERDIGFVQNEFKGLKNMFARDDIASVAGNSGALVSVKGVRLGEHPGKTRLVFDLDGPADFKFNLDNAQKLLVISLPGAGWTAAQEHVYKNNKILQAYAAKAAKAGGSVVVVKLRAPAKVLSSAKLGKNAAGMHRIFLDIALL